MPYKIQRKDKKYAVVNADTGETVPGGLHTTRDDALAHMQALYSNVEDASKSDDSWLSTYNDVLAQTLDTVAAQLAADGIVHKQKVLALKSTDDGGATIAGWALIFTDPEHLDLTDTYFPPATAHSLMLNFYENAPLWYEHGADPDLLWTPIGERTATKLYPHGVWLEHRLFPNVPNIDAIVQGIQDGEYGYSTDSVEHMVERGLNTGDGALYAWPLVGCSITRNPAEPALGRVTVGNFAQGMKAIGKREVSKPQLPTLQAKKADYSGDLMMNIIQQLAAFLGLDADAAPDEVLNALEMYCDNLEQSGQVTPDMTAAMGLPNNATAPQVTQKLKAIAGAYRDQSAVPPPPTGSMTPATMSATQDEEQDGMPGVKYDDGAADPNVAPINPMVLQGQTDVYPRVPVINGTSANYDALKAARKLANKTVSQAIPYAVSNRANEPRTYTTRSFNVNRNELYLPLSYAFHDMFAMKSGQRNGFKSMGFKSMSYSSGPAGGYILEQEISDDILDPLRADAVVFKAGAREEDLDGVQVKSIPAMLTAPAAYWPGEAQTVTSSQPVYRMITLVPKPLAVLVQRPFNFFKNMNPRAEEQLKQQIIKSMMLEIDRVALLGEGAAGTSGNTGSRPTGLLNITGVTVTQLGANDSVVNNNGRAPTFADLVNAEGVLDDANIPQGGMRSWVMHSRSKRRFTGLTDNFGRPLLRESWGSADPDRELLGYPYYVENQIPTTVTTGTNTDTSYIFYGDWRYLIVGMTTRVELVLDQTYAASLLQGLLAYVYVDVAVEYPQAFNVLSAVR